MPRTLPGRGGGLSDGEERPAAGPSGDEGPDVDAPRPAAAAEDAPGVDASSAEETASDDPSRPEPAEGASPEPGEGPAATAPVEARSTQETPDAAEVAPAEAGPSGEEPEAEAAKPGKSAARARRKPRFPALVRAFRSERPVEGTIVQVIKGGYEIRVGKARGFCPHSQIDLHREDEPERQIGKTYTFKITQLRRGGEDIVLSRRAVLEEDRAEEAKAVRATLIEGAVMQGHVVGTAAFGAFIDLGAGVLGLAHISELSHQRVKSVDDAVKVGDTVRVRILKLKESGRISLSIRRAEDDPWADVESRFEVGGVYPGTVQRVADFGAFVELAPGVEALAPASEFPPTAGGWKQGLEAGTQRQWHVLSVDAKARRVSVTPPGEAAAADPLTVGLELAGQVQRVERYGVFVWLAPGRVGLMPRAMTGAPEGADLRRRFRIGDRVEVTVVEIDEDGRRIRLTKKGVKPRSEHTNGAPVPEPEATSSQDEAPASFGTSLADKLRAALGQNDEGS
jgi:small subunit ribosomal protein S1